MPECSRCGLTLVPSQSPFARDGQLDCPASGRDGWQHDSHVVDLRRALGRAPTVAEFRATRGHDA